MYRLAAAVAILALTNVAGSQPAPNRVDQFGDPLPDGAVARLGTTRYRHGGLDLLGFTSDGKSLMYLGGGAFELMDIATGKRSKVFSHGEGQQQQLRFAGFSNSVVISADAKVVASSSMGNDGNSSVSVIDVATGKERKRFGSADLFKNGGQFFQTEISLTPDGKWLMACGGRNGLSLPLVWVDTETGQVVHDIAPEKGRRFGPAQFSRDGLHIVTLESGDMRKGVADAGPRLRIIDAARGISVRSLELPPNAIISGFELCPDNKTLIAFSQQGGPLRLFDFSEGKDVKEVRAFAEPQAPSSFALARDGKQLFILSNNKIHHWDVQTGKQVRQIDVVNFQRNDGLMGGFGGGPMGRMSLAKALAVSNDGKMLAFSGSNSVQIFDAETGKQQAGASASAAIGAIRFAPDGNGLLVSNTDNVIKMWDPRTAKLATTFARFDQKGPQRQMIGLEFSFMLTDQAAFSADGKLVGIRNGDSGVGVWNAITGAPVKWYGAEPQKEARFDSGGFPVAFAFAPRGNMLATSIQGGIKLWDAGTGQGLRSWAWAATNAAANPNAIGGNETGMLSLAFSPDGKTLAGGGIDGTRDGIPRMTLIFWETSTGKERLRVATTGKGSMATGIFELDMVFSTLHQMPLALVFSPDGKHLMMGTLYGLHLLDAATGKEIVSFSGQMVLGRTATFSTDGKLLFVGRGDGLVRVIEVASGRVLRDAPAHEEAVSALALSPDGKMLASGSGDSTVLLWDVAELTKPQPAAKAVTAKELEKLWIDLADSDAVKAYQAIAVLGSAPADAVPFLKTHLKAVTPVDPKLLAKLFDDLNNTKFNVREKANFEVEKLGELAGPMLREQLAANPSLEMRQRMEKLLAKLSTVQSPETLQATRAIEVLERIGTREAMEIVAEVAKGAPGHRVTEDAREAVERMKGK